MSADQTQFIDIVDSLGPFPPICDLCKKPIEEAHFRSALMVSFRNAQTGMYQADGPFHAECVLSRA